MPGIEDLKTDAQIASILHKLKEVDVKPIVVPEEVKVVDDSPEEEKQLQVSAPSVEVRNSSEINGDTKHEETTEDLGFAAEVVLPWFNHKDKDTDNLHYLKLKDGDDLVSTFVKMPTTANDLAALKMRSDFICEVDYYKFSGDVLYVRQLESNYGTSRVNTHESVDIVVEDTRFISEGDVTVATTDNTDTMVRVPTDDISTEILSSDKYYHFVVFTSKGIADFITSQDDVKYPYACSSLKQWFEETSNSIRIINPRFDKNDLVISEDASKIKDFNYDLITMHRPGVITLDSMDNSESNYQLHIQLKNEYSFIPYTSVLKYLKDFSRKQNRSIDEFRRFIDRYFEIII